MFPDLFLPMCFQPSRSFIIHPHLTQRGYFSQYLFLNSLISTFYPTFYIFQAPGKYRIWYFGSFSVLNPSGAYPFNLSYCCMRLSPHLYLEGQEWMKSFHPDLTEEDSPLKVYTSCYNSFFLLRQKNPLSRAPGKPGNFATGRMIENCTVSVKENYKAIIISSECFKVALRKLKTRNFTRFLCSVL